jgi:glycerophosphoryl diester phosphodiesterase
MNRNSSKKIDIQGHRGCRGLLPENSLQAFKKAIAVGVDTLELDVVISKDKHVVTSHEPYLNHEIALDLNRKPIAKADEKSFNLYKMDYDTIKQYDCGTKAHPRFPEQAHLKVYKPLLKELFEVAEALNPKIKYNIELKSLPEYYGVFSPEPDEFVSLVLKTIKDAGVADRTNLQSFDINILEAIKTQDPKMEVALLVDEHEAIQRKLEQLSYIPEIISPYFKLLSQDVVTRYQSLGFKIIPWTVNNIEDLEIMISYQVDGIITDYPNRLIKLLSL